MNAIDSITSQFSNKTLPKAEWTHHAHIAVAFAYLDRYKTIEETVPHVRADISAYNLSVGTANTDDSGYHETITAFWVSVAHAYLAETKQKDPNSAYTAFIQLACAKSDFPFDFYSRELLFSVRARHTWVEPDLLPISTIAEKMSALEVDKNDSNR